jgi:hypothetical protein
MTEPTDPQIHFSEEQSFRQPWLWALLLASLLLVLGLFAYGMVQQLLLGRPWGSRPLPDWGLLLVGTSAILLSGGITYLFLRLRLITQVRDDGLLLHFVPLRRRLIPWNKIQGCEARTYRPLREYGGWGIRFSRAGIAYNVRGNQGVQLQLRDDRPLLVGSQQAQRLADSIRQRIQ